MSEFGGGKYPKFGGGKCPPGKLLRNDQKTMYGPNCLYLAQKVFFIYFEPSLTTKLAHPLASSTS